MAKVEGTVGDFKFYSANKGINLTLDLFQKLLKEQVLTKEDQQISDEILDSLTKKGTLPYHWSPQEGHWLENNDPSRWLEYILYRFKFRLYPHSVDG